MTAFFLAVWLAVVPGLSATIHKDGSKATLRYPPGGPRIEVCVEAEGKYEDKWNPGDYISWWSVSCWPPFIGIEDYKLRPDTVKIRVTLFQTETDAIETPWLNVRPDVTSSDGIAENMGNPDG